MEKVSVLLRFESFKSHGIQCFERKTMARSYCELLVWQKAKVFAVPTYQATARPKLTSSPSFEP